MPRMPTRCHSRKSRCSRSTKRMRLAMGPHSGPSISSSRSCRNAFPRSAIALTATADRRRVKRSCIARAGRRAGCSSPASTARIAMIVDKSDARTSCCASSATSIRGVRHRILPVAEKSRRDRRVVVTRAARLPYHRMDTSSRSAHQARFQSDEGMWSWRRSRSAWYRQPDVRFVAHSTCPRASKATTRKPAARAARAPADAWWLTGSATWSAAPDDRPPRQRRLQARVALQLEGARLCESAACRRVRLLEISGKHLSLAGNAIRA